MPHSAINDFDQASNEFRFTTAIVSLAGKLRHSQYVDWSIYQIIQLALTSIGKDPWGYRYEFVQLTNNALIMEESYPK